MTTPEAAIAKAYELQHAVQRAWPGYDAPVDRVWCNNSLAKAGQCGVQGAQHCIATVGTIWEEIGLTPGDDYPFPIWYTPAVHQASDAGGFSVDTPAPGDGVLIDWEGNGEDDHGEFVLAADNWPASVTTMGFNTDESGQGNIFERPASLISCIIRPRWHYDGAPTATTPAVAPTPPPPIIPPLGADDMADKILKVPAQDGSGNYDMFYVLEGVLMHADPLLRVDGEALPVVWFATYGQWQAWYLGYCLNRRLDALTGRPL